MLSWLPMSIEVIGSFGSSAEPRSIWDSGGSVALNGPISCGLYMEVGVGGICCGCVDVGICIGGCSGLAW